MISDSRIVSRTTLKFCSVHSASRAKSRLAQLFDAAHLFSYERFTPCDPLCRVFKVSQFHCNFRHKPDQDVLASAACRSTILVRGSLPTGDLPEALANSPWGYGFPRPVGFVAAEDNLSIAHVAGMKGSGERSVPFSLTVIFLLSLLR